MASVFLSDTQGLKPFDCTETAGISARWERWLRAFELYAAGKGVKNVDQKKALLLHTAGLSVQDIYFTLNEEGGTDSYQKVKATLNKYFKPQANVPYERLCFRETSQLANETIEQFVTRLRQKAQTCEFGDGAAVDEQIRDQVISKCLSHELRRKLLQKGRALTLPQLREIARSMEESEKQARSIEGASGEVSSEVNSVSGKSDYKGDASTRNVKCFCCGNVGHKANDHRCPARGKQCRWCKGTGHFEAVCKTKKKQNTGRGSGGARGPRRPDARRKDGPPHHVRQVEAEDKQSDDSEYAFGISDDCNVSSDGKISVKIGGLPATMIIDSGASCNVIGRNVWEYLKANKVECVSSKVSKKLFAYGSNQPLQVAGTFTAEVSVGERVLSGVEFVVIENEGHALLGRETAIALEVLKLGPQVNSLKRYNPLHNQLDEFHTTFEFRDKLSDKLDELVKLDIIEKVSGPSPVVVVPKPSGDIRLCVDMRQANMAVKRERYPIPTIDEVLQDLNQSKFFSKLDLNSAYHQIELSPESRDITTFCTHKGLYRYKRLMFGISCAPEMYQKVLQQVLQDCDGAHNILDDVIVHAATEEEHDRRFENVVRVLSSKGLTLNRDKCQFKMSHLEFMGHVLSARGIGPADVKVKAVVDAREPTIAAEVRSFLGLVNFTARFIPDLATVSAPLRQLTKNGEPFVWGLEQQKSFEETKEATVQCSDTWIL
ncbi:hypothetical protein ACROYT_G000337 [Oculina patagonica]